MKAAIAGVFAAAAFGLAFTASLWEDAHPSKHLPLPLGIPALVCAVVTIVLTVQLIRTDTRRWKTAAANLQAVTQTVTLTRQQQPQPPVSIENGHTIIDLIPVDVRELAS